MSCEIDFRIYFDERKSQSKFRSDRKKSRNAGNTRYFLEEAAIMQAGEMYSSLAVVPPADPRELHWVKNRVAKACQEKCNLMGALDGFRNRLHGIFVRQRQCACIAHFPLEHEKRKKRFRLANRPRSSA
jgi:hypothetical protein